MDNIVLYAVGLLAQLLFSARILIQWIMTERAKKVVSPVIFWALSMIASYLLFIYGWFRNDFSIMLGQVIAYYVYIWNLNKKEVWSKIPKLLQLLLYLTPIAGLCYILSDWTAFMEQCFKNENIPLLLVIYGSLGQIIFTLRFVYQFLYSRAHGESLLPAGFWIISLTGSLIIVSYAIVREDPVLILGQSFGFVSYTRNLVILHRQKMQEKSN